jgi:hypothetical protein
MNDFLNWFGRNIDAGILVCIVVIILAGILLAAIRAFIDGVINALRAFTGKYPPPRPVVECDCPSDPCKCCADGECENEDCRCFGLTEDE